MYLDYAKIKSGQIKQPVLQLRTLAGKALGAVPFAHNLSFEINYADVSTISFDVPFQSDGVTTPLYNQLTSYKVIYTENFGVYVITSPSKSGDGMREVKTVRGYSLEKLLERKKLYLEEGTYDFWNPADPADTILGRITELDQTWSVGYVSPRLIGCYRTFDAYNSDALSFCYGDAMEKYNCTIVFDVYKKTINAYDASESRGSLPIYLSYQNLVDSVEVEEVADDITTKLHVYGSDSLSIREVNPIGTDYLVDLSFFVSNGDLDIRAGGSKTTLAEKYLQWQQSIQANQPYYTGLIGARASKSAQKLAGDVHLTELKGELETLLAQQSVTIQALALETTEEGKAARQAELDEINEKIEAQNGEIGAQEEEIETLQGEIDGYTEDISSVVGSLSLSNYFTDAEFAILNQYLIEGEVTEETFVASSVDSATSGVSSVVSGSVSVNGSSITMVELPSKRMYTFSGGTITIPNAGISAGVIRGTVEIDTNDQYVLSAYLGITNYAENSFPSGMITLSGSASHFSSDVTGKTEDGVTAFMGTLIGIQANNSRLFFTVNVSEYQKYSVAQELYDFGRQILDEQAWPVYEFSIDAANFLFQQAFAPFKDKLELGKAIHLGLGSDGVISANIIGMHIDFEDPGNFSLVFSNRFQRKNGVETWIDTIQQASSASRSFDASKYLYNQAAGKATQVSAFMEGTLDAAVNTIIGAANQSVVINGAGIQVGGSNQYQLRIVDNMIAMTDDGWKTAKLAIGRFATPETGEQWGVNAEMIAGKLFVGQSCVLENTTDDGVMMFKVDSTGAWLYNSTFVLQKDNGGLMLLDPAYGIMAGSGMLFNANGTTVTPEFIDEHGDILLDDDGMPQNANFFLDIRDGSAYFRGRVKAISGAIGGWTLKDNYLCGGRGNTFVALNGSGGNTESAYALWAGAEVPASAPFSVRKDGSLFARNATISGTLNAPRLVGTLYGSGIGQSWIEGCGIRVGVNRNASTGYNFYVDSNGNVNMQGSLVLKNGSITWSALDSSVTENINGIQDNVDNLSQSVDTRLENFNTRVDRLSVDVNDLANSMWTEQQIANIASTQITNSLIASPQIYGAYIQGGTINGARFLLGNFGSIYDGYGSDGVNQTNLVCIDSTKGIRISATNGMGLNAGKGLWIEGDVYIRINGKLTCLNKVIKVD